MQGGSPADRRRRLDRHQAFHQLAPGGILVIPVGSNSLQELVRVPKREDGSVREERMGSCVFVRLVGKHGWEANC